MKTETEFFDLQVVVEKSISMAVWHTSSASPFHLANLSSNPLPNAEGGLFWCYGLISFARFLGWSSERGWAWNRAPSAGYPTAEMVESTVIFLYGATNTWMERCVLNFNARRRSDPSLQIFSQSRRSFHH
jgi:hypothetical protein